MHRSSCERILRPLGFSVLTFAANASCLAGETPWGVPYRVTETVANIAGDFGHAVAIKDGTTFIGQASDVFGGAYRFTAGTGNNPVPYDPETFKEDAYGYSLAVGSGTVLVGNGPSGFFNHTSPGAVHLYDAASGESLGSITPPELMWGDDFGFSIDAAENFAVVGAPGGDPFPTYQEGSAHVIDLTSREIVATLLPDDPGDAGRVDRNLFGDAVALTDNHLFVGEPGNDRGKVHIFDSSSHQRLLVISAPEPEPGNEASRIFGTSLDATDSLLVVGDIWATTNGAPTGVAHVFDIDTGLELHRLRPDDADDLYFGQSVAVSDRYVVVGSPGADDWRGRAYVFDASTGEQVAKLQPTLPFDVPGAFGHSVAIEDDVIVVGAPNELSVYVFDPARVAGDFDGDGAVGTTDYAVWRTEFGVTEGNPRADATGDTRVDAADYTRWRDAVALESIPAGQHSVPEPAAWQLALSIILATRLPATFRWRRV